MVLGLPRGHSGHRATGWEEGKRMACCQGPFREVHGCKVAGLAPSNAVALGMNFDREATRITLVPSRKVGLGELVGKSCVASSV